GGLRAGVAVRPLRSRSRLPPDPGYELLRPGLLRSRGPELGAEAGGGALRPGPGARPCARRAPGGPGRPSGVALRAGARADRPLPRAPVRALRGRERARAGHARLVAALRPPRRAVDARLPPRRHHPPSPLDPL